MIRLSPLALAGAILATTLNIAAVTPASARTTIRVPYGDLDMGSTQGRTTLATRLGAAVNRVCIAANDRALTNVSACRRAVMAQARSDMASVIAANTIQLASR